MKKYEISFNRKKFNSKPSKDEIGKISNNLYAKSMTYTELANMVGENGCTFSPAVYNGKRKKENYLGQQLIALDFDDGVTFKEIRDKAERYRLPILFAYKTFSYTEKHEKFRVVFALEDCITDSFTGEAVTGMFMKIFGNCDEACKDSSRMFFGGKGLLHIADEPIELLGKDIIISFVSFMNDRYGDKHYTREITKFYQNHNIKYNKLMPVIDNGHFICEAVKNNPANADDKSNVQKKGRRSVTRNFEWSELHRKCRLYRDFAEGNEYYYYPQLFHIATNLVNIDKGKNEFLRVLNLPCNSEYEAYHKRNWKTILNVLINMDYQPKNCCGCPYEQECMHSKNMILTAKPMKSTILQTLEKSYVSIEEAERDLEENFLKAVNSDKNGIHIIKAQTGIGKTNLYLNYLSCTDKKFLIAVPTHKLKTEVYNTACAKGITDISYTPEMPEFSSELQSEIEHIYSVGAGKYVLEMLSDLHHNIGSEHEDFGKLREYLNALNAIKEFNGHIITTHDRLLLLNQQSEILKDREVIIDEDIMRTMLSTCTISNADILKVINTGIFTNSINQKLNSIISCVGYQRFNYELYKDVDITDEILKALEDIEGDILDLTDALYIYNDGSITTFLRRKWLPCKKAIVMSATANDCIYRMLTHYDIHYYPCKTAVYMGTLRLYPKYTFSRHSILEDNGIADYLKANIGDDTVITFKAFEEQFNTKYHYGAIEGLNCLAGKNISVVGLPNVDESVYKLYGMAAGVNPDNCNMKSMRVEYNGYSFFINSFENEKIRIIQLWIIESLLEQAVGRARLLRYDCTVKVFARFPIDQAVIE